MKRYLLGIAMSLMFLFAGTGISLAGMGGFGGGGGSYGGGGYGTFGEEYCGGTGSGTGISYICEGEEEDYEDYFVKSINVFGTGMMGASMTISKSSSPNTKTSLTIYGLGPWWFWDNNGVNFPSIGDRVTVNARVIDISGTKTIIAMSITVYHDHEEGDTTEDKATLQLRDPETCYPNWAGGWSR